MELLPVGLQLEGKPVLVVGGGAVALRKIRLLLQSHARVEVVSPAVRPELRRMAVSKKIVWKRRPYRVGDATSSPRPALIFVCTDSADINGQVQRDAERAGIWVNRADNPSESSVHIPSVARFGRLTLAIFSGGRGPVYVKYVRKRLEKILGSTVATELNLLTEFRQALRGRVQAEFRRKRILTRLVEDGTLEKMARLPARRRREMLMACLEDRA